MKVLHVDDDRDILWLAKLYLEKEDDRLEIETAESAEEALKRLNQKDFDLVISDYAMPKINGLEFLQKLRERSDIPFILFTGKGREEVAMKALNLGADRYLRKSHDVETQYKMLAEDVVQLVHLHQAEEDLKRSQERLELALKGARAGLWDWFLDTGKCVYNEQYAKMLGYSLDELQPSTKERWRNLCHPDDAEKSDRIFHEHLAGERDTYECELRMKHKNGQWIWVRDRGQVVEWDDEGNPIRVSGTHVDITDKKKAENALRRKTEEQDLLLNSSPTQIWYLKDINTYGAVNEAHARFVGVPKEQLEYSKLDDFLSDKEAEICKIGNRRVFQTGKQIHTEEWLRNSKDEKRLIAITKTPKLDSDGKVKYVVCSGHDITERKRARDNLRRSKEKYRTIVSSMQDSIFVYDDNNVHVDYYVSDKSQLVAPPDEFMGKAIDDILPIEVAKEYIECMNRVRETGEVETFDYPLRIDSEVRWFSSRISEHENGEDIICVVREITERKNAENKLRFQSHILNSIDDIVITVDLSGKITYVNKAFANLVGISPNELVGKPVEIFADRTEMRGTEQDILETALSQGRWEGEVVNYDDEGKERLLRSRIQLLHDDVGNPLGLVAISTEVPEHQQERKRRQLLHQLLSHEVANKSQIIQSSLELLESSNLDNKQQILLNKANQAVEEGGRVIDMIRELRDMKTEELQAISINSLIKDVTKRKQALAQEKQITIETQFPKNNLKAKGGLLLEPLLSNLVENAIEHSDGSIIRVSCERCNPMIKLSVEDDGIGIPKETRNQIENQMLSQRIKNNNGLGLSLVKEIVELYEGSIEIKYSELGGTAVHVYLNCAEDT
jgi:PAS domain S-box-containing protein